MHGNDNPTNKTGSIPGNADCNQGTATVICQNNIQDWHQDLRRQLTTHPLYQAIGNSQQLAIFMQHHVVAVWDFMVLLQRLLKSQDSPGFFWAPPKRPAVKRFLSSIWLVEETDEIGGGQVLSHFELYRQAMTGFGVDTSPVTTLVASLNRIQHPEQAAAIIATASGVPAAAKDFLSETLACLDQPDYVLAAIFFHGRENLIPDMFRAIVAGLRRQDPRLALFETYLQRHIEVDEGDHGPAALALLQALIDDSRKAAHAKEWVARTLAARLRLWDSILRAIGSSQPS